MIKTPKDCSKEELFNLLSDSAKNWLAHDGLWFLAVEEKYGLETAIALDAKAWEKFSVVEAERIMKRLDLKPNGGIPALIKALNFRLYAYINEQEVVEVSENRCVFRMNTCRVQEARERKNLPAFPCKPVGLVEYTNFARTIDPMIKTRCISCPPDRVEPPPARQRSGGDSHPKNYWCAWEFSI